MSLTFSRSMRSLRQDNFRATWIGLVLAGINMLVLIGWFFLARVTLYEVGNQLEWSSEGLIAATFTSEGMDRLRQGQPAVVRLDLGADQPALTLPAYVYQIPDTGERVVLAIEAGDVMQELQQTTPKGQVEVEVAYVTPAELTMRATGKYLNQNRLVGPSNGNGNP